MEDKEERKENADKIQINGTTYVKYNVLKELKYQKFKDAIFLIVIVFVIIALVMAITTLVKSRDIINKDALIIGMEKHGFVSCQCVDEQGTQWQSKGGGFLAAPVAKKDLFTDFYDNLQKGGDNGSS